MSNTKVHLLYFILFLILVSNIWLIKIRWENSILANDIENTRYEILKLKEINLNLTTEKNFLTSLAKTEMSLYSRFKYAERRNKVKNKIDL